MITIEDLNHYFPEYPKISTAKFDPNDKQLYKAISVDKTELVIMHNPEYDKILIIRNRDGSIYKKTTEETYSVMDRPKGSTLHVSFRESVARYTKKDLEEMFGESPKGKYRN